MHHCALLIVYDDPVWLRAAAQYFTFHKFKVHTAGSCFEGLKVFNSIKPDCVLLDYNLLDADAEAFCNAVRSAEKLIRTPIVVISGEDQRELQAYTVCQADGFVLKGNNWQRAVAVVEMVMRRVRWERGVLHKGDIKLEKNGFCVFRGSRRIATLSPGQFHVLYLLVQESPRFVSEDMISVHLFNSDFAPEVEDSIRGLMQRLRKKLGPQVGRRIKSKVRKGWVYVQPRLRDRASGTVFPEDISNSSKK